MLKLFGSPRKIPKDAPNKSLVPVLEGAQPYNPFTQIQVHQYHTQPVRHLLSHGNRVVTAGDDGLVVIWNIQTGERHLVLTEHTRPITCLELVTRGATTDPATRGATTDHATDDSATDVSTILLSAASDKLICMWDVDGGQLIRKLAEHQYTARCVHSVLSGLYICSAGERLTLWSPGGDMLYNLHRPQEEDINRMVELRDARIACAVDKRIVVYQVKEGPELHLHRRLVPHREAITEILKINDACFISGSLDGSIVLWSAQALAASRYFNSMSDYLGDNRVLPYSIQFMVCLAERYLVCAIGTGFSIYDIIPGLLVAQKQHAHHSKIISLAIVHSGGLLATCSEDGSIRLWGCMKNFLQHSTSNLNAGPLEKLLGIGPSDLALLKEKREKLEPQLLGECLGHSGSVRACVGLGLHGMVSTGSDGLAIHWKDGLRERMTLNQSLYDLYNHNDLEPVPL